METTKVMIEIMQAHLDGKAIEVCMTGGKSWDVCKKPTWLWGNCDYRIKQEKKKVYLYAFTSNIRWHNAEDYYEDDAYFNRCMGGVKDFKRLDNTMIEVPN